MTNQNISALAETILNSFQFGMSIEELHHKLNDQGVVNTLTRDKIAPFSASGLAIDLGDEYWGMTAHREWGHKGQRVVVAYAPKTQQGWNTKAGEFQKDPRPALVYQYQLDMGTSPDNDWSIVYDSRVAEEGYGNLDHYHAIAYKGHVITSFFWEGNSKPESDLASVRQMGRQHSTVYCNALESGEAVLAPTYFMP